MCLVFACAIRFDDCSSVVQFEIRGAWFLLSWDYFGYLGSFVSLQILALVVLVLWKMSLIFLGIALNLKFSLGSMVILTILIISPIQFSSVQSLSHVRLFATPWIAARQASLSVTNSRSSLRLTLTWSIFPSVCIIFYFIHHCPL